MNVQSKFLSGDVAVTDIIPNGDRLKVVGTIKGLYPIEVELAAEDIIAIAQHSFDLKLIVHTAEMLLKKLR